MNITFGTPIEGHEIAFGTLTNTDRLTRVQIAPQVEDKDHNPDRNRRWKTKIITLTLTLTYLLLVVILLTLTVIADARQRS